MSEACGVIPARISSTRLERKPLVDICGLPMVIHVYRRARQSAALSDVVIATDSLEVLEVARRFGAKCVMTRPDHVNGIERTAEVASGLDCDLIVLINGDEAMLRPEHIAASLEALVDSGAPTSFLGTPSQRYGEPSDFKLVVDERGHLLYVSRQDIPYGAEDRGDSLLKGYHILSFRKEFLLAYPSLEKRALERAEGHDHLRALEHGFPVAIGIVEHDSTSVDTPEDLAIIRARMRSDTLFRQYRLSHD